MKININGIDNTIEEEKELISSGTFGYNVVVHFKDGRKESYRNVTEIHLNYRGNTYAIESDIHSTGVCPYRGNDEVAQIVAIDALKKHPEF